MTDKQKMSLIKYKWKKFYPNVKLSYRIKKHDLISKTLFLTCRFGKYSKNLYFRYKDRDGETFSQILQIFEEEFKRSALRMMLNDLKK